MIGPLPSKVGFLIAQMAPSLPPQWRIRWTWDWPLWISLLAAAGASAWVVAIYWREVSPAGRPMRALLALLRLSALALVVAMFAQPTVEWFRLGRPRLALLVDRSASMAVRDGAIEIESSAADLSRIDAWKQVLAMGEQPLVDVWQTAYRLDVVAFDEKFDHLDSKEKGSTLIERLQACEVADKKTGGTRLGDAVDFVLRELPGPPPAAVVIFTDGLVTRGQSLGEAAQRARSLRVPLYTVAVGSQQSRPDVAIDNLLVEDVVFPGDRLQVEATLHSTGYAGRSVEVTLRNTAQDTVLARTTVQLPNDGRPETVRLALRPNEPGVLSLQLSVEPLEGETYRENNVVRQTVEVRDEKIRVLFVQASPSYEYRALKSLLERDPAIELHVLLQQADANFSEVDQTALSEFPALAEQLFEYDVVMLGDVDPTLLPRSTWPLLQRFVTQHGGGMVCIAGPNFMPYAFRDIRSLQVLLPMQLDGLPPRRPQVGNTLSYPIQPTAVGWQSPSLQLGETTSESQAIWRGLPAVTWLFEVERIKPGAQVLAESVTPTSPVGRRLPVILRHYVGAGEVLFHATDETWRWRWQTDDRYFARYWGQVVRQLGRGRLAANRQGIELTTDRSQYLPGEAVRFQVRFRNPSEAPAEDRGVAVELQTDVLPRREIRLQRRSRRRGVFEATVDNLSPGNYEARLLRPDFGAARVAARFEIRQPPHELARTAVDRRVLREAAEISGGKAYTLKSLDRLTEDLPQPRETILEKLPDSPLWNRHAVIGLLVLVLTGEWLLRRRCGML